MSCNGSAEPSAQGARIMRKSYLSPVILAALLGVLFAVVPAAASAADPVPPVTTCDAPSGWQGAPFTVHFTASDDDSGVAVTWAAIDGGPMREVGGPAGASIDIPALCHFPVSKLWYDPYITGSLGRFVPERYHVPIVTVELLRPKLGSGMRAALLAAAR
jgi:hypothetical protein